MLNYMCQYATKCPYFIKHPRNSKKCSMICSINPTLTGDIPNWLELATQEGKIEPEKVKSWEESGFRPIEDHVKVTEDNLRTVSADEYDDMSKPAKRQYRELMQEEGFKVAQERVMGETIPAPVELKKQSPQSLRQMADQMEARKVKQDAKDANMAEAMDNTFDTAHVPKRRKKSRR